MTYSIEGLPLEEFVPLFAMTDGELAVRNARRVTADADRGFPCRVSLTDAKAGETLILLHHVTHDVATPFRSAYAIYVREGAEQAPGDVDCTPPVFEGHFLALRAFDGEGMLKGAALAPPGEADIRIRELFDNDAIAYIDVHNAAHGCFSARVRRH